MPRVELQYWRTQITVCLALLIIIPILRILSSLTACYLAWELPHMLWRGWYVLYACMSPVPTSLLSFLLAVRTARNHPCCALHVFNSKHTGTAPTAPRSR